MATLARTQLQAAADRADALALPPSEVALQTSDTMPDYVTGDDDEPLGSVLDTAGSEQHGEVRSFTVGEVRQALAAFDAHEKRSAAGRKAAETRQERTSDTAPTGKAEDTPKGGRQGTDKP